MIICYHKVRRKFYVIKDNTKAGRKFLHYAPTFDECAAWIISRGETPTTSKSARDAMGVVAWTPHPTPSDASSDEATGRELLSDPEIERAARTSSDISDLAKVIHSSIGKPGDIWENYLNDAKQVMYLVKALDKKRV